VSKVLAKHSLRKEE